MCDRVRRARYSAEREGAQVSFAVCLHAICSRLLIAVANAVANCELQLQLAMLPGLATRGLGVNHVVPCPYPPPSHHSLLTWPSWRQHIVSESRSLLALQVFYMPPTDSSSIALAANCSCICQLWALMVVGLGGVARHCTQSDNSRLRIFAFCVNFYGKL